MSEQALEGVKVADFSWVGMGPITVRYLADHGATVIHVESATSVDTLRVTPPYKDNIPGLNRSGYFANYNANKYGISLNMNHPRALEVARRLVAWADIVVESFTPGTIEEWGLGYDELKRMKPEIIMLSLTCQGQTGPHAQLPGYGTQMVSLAGVTYLTGWPDRLPAQPYGAYTDLIAPRFAAAALIAALDFRHRTGKGQHLDLSQFEAATHFLAPLLLDYAVNRRVAIRMGNHCPYAAPHDAYRCRGDDRWCAIAVFTDEEWHSFCRVLGNPSWAKESRFATLLKRIENATELDRLIEEWTKEHSAEEVMAMMQAAGVAAGVVETAEDIHNDPQLEHRHHFGVLHHQEIGLHTYDSPAFQLSETPADMRLPAPCLGQHNEYVYTKILGMSDEEFVELLGAGVFD